jgi:mannose/cellobiose epimerase-like protein (N-acyl-D-glucosamine 2-epimerase family)
MPSYLSNSTLKTPANRELYEDAFVLLSFAQFYSQTKDESLLPWLDATMERLTNSTYFGRAAGGLGFNEHASLQWELLEDAPRTQNSHMHLLEAFLAHGARFPTEGYTRGLPELRAFAPLEALPCV